ncbi:MAG: isocitrate lyase/phosphoenolpyruvate mutase family protein [Hyphomicrobiales bacterium]|nr:isocitrate lyase/phosphoenolpyruvate mutase family protein [Hyphomicrobiales bacterium]
MSAGIIEKAEAFRALHEGPGTFVIPNPYDVGTARLLAHMGFKALATTSAGFAFSQGLAESVPELTRERVLWHARDLVDATPLPVSADLERGFGDDPKTVAETVRLAAETGLAGCSIEDATANPDQPIYDFSLAVERIAAAVDAARALGRPFTLTARAENYLHGRPDPDDTLRRLQAFEKAGADVLYAPGPPDADIIRQFVEALEKPVNAIITRKGTSSSVKALKEAGVRRISVGSLFALAALGAFQRAAREVLEDETSTFTTDIASFAEVDAVFRTFSKQ